MKNHKFIFILFGIILFASLIQASVLDEKTLSSLSTGDVIVNKGEEVCKSYSFDLRGIDEKSKAYLQLMVKNYIPIKTGVDLTFNLNGLEISKIKGDKIQSNNVILLSNVKSNENLLEICVKNDFLPRFIIDTEKSTLGNYYVAEIKKEDFYQEAPSRAYINTMIPIKLFIRNSGYDSVYVEVVNATELFLYNSNLENVSGETSFKGTINPQETISLNYFVKAEKGINFATPLAKLNYKDRFNQTHTMFLTTQIISLEEQETKITAYTDIFKTIEPNKVYTGHLIIKNDSENTLKEIYIIPYFNGEIILSKEKITNLNPKDVLEIPFTIKTFKEEEYSLVFTINYLDGVNEKNVGTQQKTISAENKNNIENTAITILIILTIFLFIWIVKI